MKKLYKISCAFIGLLLLGCGSKTYENDNSYETKIYGTYEKYSEVDMNSYNNYGGLDVDDNGIYKMKNTLTLDDNNTFTQTIVDGSKSRTDNGVYEIEDIGDDILKISCFNSDGDNTQIYKYKNIIGYYNTANTTITKSKHFDLSIGVSDYGDGWVFNKNGEYHYCSNIDNCSCDSTTTTFYNYEQKDSIIYINSVDGEMGDFWQILYYVVDDGLFSPSLYKIEE